MAAVLAEVTLAEVTLAMEDIVMAIAMEDIISVAAITDTAVARITRNTDGRTPASTEW
jgi:hypothetical protein